MNKKFLNTRNIFIALVILFTLLGLFFANYFYAKNYTGGKYFQTQWIATRAAIFEKESPYSESVLYKVQTSAYGRPAMAGEYEFRFTYPYFAFAIFLPFGLIKNLVIARAIWMLVLELIVMLTYWVSLNLGNWKPKPRTNILLFSFIVTLYPTLRAVIDGNLIIITTFLLITSLICVRDHQDEAAGILLLGLLLEFQYTFVILLIILGYGLINRRTEIITYFFGSLIVLVGFSFLIKPDWFSGYLGQLSKSIVDFSYSSFGGTIRTLWNGFGQRLAIAITILTTILLVFEWYRAQKYNFRYFIWFIYMAIVTIQWVGLPSDPGNFFLLLPGLIFIMQVINERWKIKGELLIYCVCLLLYISIWVSFFILHKSGPAYVEPTLFYFILPMVEFFLLYWSKWWIKKNPKI